MVEQAVPETHQPTLSYGCQCLSRVTSERDVGSSNVTIHIRHTWSLDMCFGLFSTSILLRPTPMAPDDTMMTLCPSFLSFTAVSTMRDRMESNGSWLFSSTMELVPEMRITCQTNLPPKGHHDDNDEDRYPYKTGEGEWVGKWWSWICVLCLLLFFSFVWTF